MDLSNYKPINIDEYNFYTLLFFNILKSIIIFKLGKD